MTEKNDWEELTTGGRDIWNFREEFEKAGSPEDGIEFQGIYHSVKSNVGQYGSQVYTLEDMGGISKDIWGNAGIDTTLGSLIADGTIEEGDIVKIVYLGKQKNPKTGRMFHSFKVYKKIEKK